MNKCIVISGKAEMRKVRRNLFDPVESGMGDTSVTEPPKTPQRASQRIAKKDLLSTTPKGKNSSR